MLESVRKLFAAVIWVEHEKHWDAWISSVQRNRNAIHAFYDRKLGGREDFLKSLRRYAVFLQEVDSRLPYHEDFARFRWEEALELGADDDIKPDESD